MIRISPSNVVYELWFILDNIGQIPRVVYGNCNPVFQSKINLKNYCIKYAAVIFQSTICGSQYFWWDNDQKNVFMNLFTIYTIIGYLKISSGPCSDILTWYLTFPLYFLLLFILQLVKTDWQNRMQPWHVSRGVCCVWMDYCLDKLCIKDRFVRIRNSYGHFRTNFIRTNTHEWSRLSVLRFVCYVLLS